MNAMYSEQKSKQKSVKCGSILIGDGSFVIIAGPCAIESYESFLATAKKVKSLGATVLRGGIFKMRTHSHSFQGLGLDGLKIALQVKQEVNMPFVSEITDPRQLKDFIDVVDIFQIGSRNMYNYTLLKEIGQTKKPVLLKRGLSATVEEWLGAAEYINHEGNENIILCERGIRTFERITRNTLDLAAVAYLKQNTLFPIIVDPSHGTGIPALITPMSCAAKAVGADGIMIEVHQEPQKALSDGNQALNFEDFASLTKTVNSWALA